MRALAITLALGLMLLPGALFASTRTFGLVIGIDEYRYIPDLDGAVNDARDIADALESIDAEVIMLLNEEASRDAILSSWRALAAKVGDGDRLVITFAGHGSNEPEFYPGNEEDGRDETLILAGFSPLGDRARERIRDDEIADLLALTPNAQVIFVADACHSGTLSRNISPALGYRYVTPGEMTNDPLPPPPPKTSKSEGREDVALFLAAVDEADKVPEFLIDGQARGALSYAFAAALRGPADVDADGALTKGEIELFVRKKVREISDGVQSPQVSPLGQTEGVIFALASASAEAAVIAPPLVPRNPFALDFDALPPVTLSHDGGSAGELLLRDLPGVTLLPEGAPADLSLELRGGVLRSMVGDVVRVIGPQGPDAFRAAVKATADKARMTRALREMSGAGAFEVRFTDGDRTYRADDIVTVEVEGRRTSNVALFNISSDGKIAFLYPVQDPTLGINDPVQIDPGNRLGLPMRVAEPFGADHIVAVETEGTPGPLIDALSALDGTTDIRALWTGLRDAHAALSPRVAVFPFHSAPR